MPVAGDSRWQSHGWASGHTQPVSARSVVPVPGWAGPGHGEGLGELLLPPGKEPGEAAWPQRPITSLPSWL